MERRDDRFGEQSSAPLSWKARERWQCALQGAVARGGTDWGVDLGEFALSVPAGSPPGRGRRLARRLFLKGGMGLVLIGALLALPLLACLLRLM